MTFAWWGRRHRTEEPRQEWQWLQTYTGRVFWPLNPDPADVDIDDIAHALALQCRFGGHCRSHYSVTQHCVVVSATVPHGYALAGLLHDAAEAYIVDLPRPIKHAPEMAAYLTVERRVHEAVRERFSVKQRLDDEVVAVADERALATEARDVMAFPPKGWRLRHPPFDFTITPWGPRLAERMFLSRFKELAG